MGEKTAAGTAYYAGIQVGCERLKTDPSALRRTAFFSYCDAFLFIAFSDSRLSSFCIGQMRFPVI
jgi:hypothetical protein